jgi:hypothetical protein
LGVGLGTVAHRSCEESRTAATITGVGE